MYTLKKRVNIYVDCVMDRRGSTPGYSRSVGVLHARIRGACMQRACGVRAACVRRASGVHVSVCIHACVCVLADMCLCACAAWVRACVRACINQACIQNTCRVCSLRPYRVHGSMHACALILTHSFRSARTPAPGHPPPSHRAGFAH